MSERSERRKRLAALGFVLALLGPVSGCRQEGEEARDEDVATEPEPTGAEGLAAAAGDAAITVKVKSGLAADPRVSALAIDVDTQNGIVTLEGDVGTEEARSAAEEVARGSEGVQDVVNMLAVGTAGAGQGSEPPEQPSGS